MKNKLRYSLLALAFVVAPWVMDSVAQAQNNVTFRVNMNIKMREGSFKPGSGDIVTVPGDINGWSTTADTLKDADADSIYTVTKSLPAGAINYKFFKTLRGGIDWEGDPNRTYTVVAGAQTLPVEYFGRDSVYTPPVDVPVTFRVNMRVKMLEQAFKPLSGDIVTVPGSLNGWSTTKDTLTDPDGDSVYTKTINLAGGTAIAYKFFKTIRSGLDWESGDNKQFTVPTSGSATIPVVYFDGDSVVNLPIKGNILWRVDMSVYNAMGWFRRTSGDTIQVRGAFNSWGGTAMTRFPGTEIYEISLPYDGTTYDDIAIKFFMKLDSAGAVARFPGWVNPNNRDGINYDHPAERGDGNRLFNLGGVGGNLQTPAYLFSSIPLAGTIKALDTVTVVFRYDMRPAMTYIDPFKKGVDTAKIDWVDGFAKSLQGNPPAVILKDDGIAPDAVAGDSIYSGKIDIHGTAHYNLQYRLTYVHGGAQTGSVDEGGGLGIQNPYRSRFIRPISSQKFPRTYTLPIDIWQKNAPMPKETFDGLTGVGDQPTVQPVSFALFQNYPNPFNPSTQIKYYLPEKALVKLAVYNLLGQKVVTLVNEEQTAGNYVSLFEAHSFPTGIYFYELQAGNFREVKKMMLLK